MKRLRVLFLSQRVPYPPTRGDKIITWRMVQRLHANHDLTCLAFAHDEDDRQGAKELERLGIQIVTVPYERFMGVLKSGWALVTGHPLTTSLLGSSRIRAEVASRAAETDLMVAFSSSMGAYLLPYAGVPRVLHFCELDSDKWRQYAQRSRWPMRWVYAREARTLLNLEHVLARAMSANIVCTPLERAVFTANLSGLPCAVMRNGIDLEYFSPEGLAPEPGHIVFTGVMNYLPNVDGCIWFATDVLPRIAEAHPNAMFTIVGANPSRAVLKLAANPRVLVTGRVPDTRPFLRRASVCVAPLRIARGIQNKVLEGLAMGLPVVGTTPATQGVGGTDGRDYLVADDPDRLAATIGNLLTHESERAALGRRGRAFVEQNYSWAQSLDLFDELIRQATDQHEH